MISNSIPRDWGCFICHVLLYIAWIWTFWIWFKEGLKRNPASRSLTVNSKLVKTSWWMWILAYSGGFGFLGLLKLLGGGKL